MRKLLFLIGILTFFLSSCGSKLVVTINFESNGGSQVASQVFTEDSVFTLPNAPTKEGYTFVGWFLDDTLNTPFSVEGVLALEPDTSITLYASWTINQYTITFDSDGGTAVSAITQDYNTSVTAPENPTKEGHTFSGWDQVIPTVIPAESITIKAVWTVNQYTITFDSNGGSAVSAITQDYGISVTAPSNPVKEGYTFSGWSQSVSETMPAENTTLTASWTINQYTITFDSDGGTAVSAITQDYNTSVTAPENPTKEGHTFSGWDQVIPTVIPAESITIKAVWTVNQYTITFDSNGGSAVSAITQDYGTSVTAPSNPVKEGYTFSGWFLDKELSNSYSLNSMIADDITLYALWDELLIVFETEYNDEIAYADTISSNEILTLSLATSGDKDWFKLYVNSNKIVEYTFIVPANVSGMWRINIYDENLNVLSVKNWSSTTTATVPVNYSGYIYILVQAHPDLLFLYNDSKVQFSFDIKDWN